MKLSPFVQRIVLIGLAVFATNLVANTVYSRYLLPEVVNHPRGLPTPWWVALFTVPFPVALVSGWLSASAEELSIGIFAILLGLLSQAIVTGALQLPGAGRAPVVPPGENLGAGVMIGTVLWSCVLAFGAALRWISTGTARANAARSNQG